jgi:5'-deoxynucleotidase YfbR-like HD superfamily hydrolase
MSQVANSRLSKQIAFINEVEKLKLVERQNFAINGARKENSAEHSWHVALMAVVLFEHSNDSSIDIFKTLKMLLIHDLVEIHAGDTWLYDEQGNRMKSEREKLAAIKLFGLLPREQEHEFLELWQEFESRETGEAIFASSIDSLQPLLNYLHTSVPYTDVERPIRSQVIEKKRHISLGSEVLWNLAVEVIDKSVDQGLFRASTDDV